MAYTLIEGQSTNRPPFFDGKNYAYWKERMMVFVQSIDDNIWKIILNGPNIPTKTTAEGNVVPKEEHEWDDEDKKKVEFNAKAMNMMYCAISFEEFQKMSRCKSAKKIWDKLQVIHEGTEQVRQIRISTLTEEYEMFTMKEEESIDEMFERFSIIINNLDAMGMTYPQNLIVRKILRSLNKQWEATATAISNGVYLRT